MSTQKINKSAIFLFFILIVLVAMVIALFFLVQTDTVAEVLKNDELVKVLLVVHDGDTAITTDVLVYYPVSKRGAVFDIPCNTGAIYSSLGRVDSIDSVYREKGIDVYRQEVEKLTGASIPFTMEINLDDFSYITDMLGGFRVFIPSPVDYVEDGVHYLLPSGAVTLDGDKVCTYLAYTLPDDSASDIQERKQNIIVAFISALNNNKTGLMNKRRFSPFSKAVVTNIEDDDEYSLISQIASIDAERLMPQTVLGNEEIVDDEVLLFPYYNGQYVKDVFKRTTTALVSASGTISDRVYVLEIQNGTSKQGLARNTGVILQGAGYNVLSMINADSQDVEETCIIDHIGNEQDAKILADFIQCEKIITEEVRTDDELEVNSLVDFTIILGKDFDGRYVR
ncbi:MAG: LCP family protein [Treponema sp.]|nr:LCP family protein [Candidatus Treponema caballi]